MIEQDQCQGFTGLWIMKEVAEDKNLSIPEVYLLSQIIALSMNQPCYASNDYFAKFMRMSIPNINKYLQKLKDKNYIKVTYSNEKNHANRRIMPNIKVQIGSNAENDSHIKSDSRHINSDSRTHIKSDIHKTKGLKQSNKTKKIKRFIKPTVEEIRLHCKQKGYNIDAEHFVDHYNSNGWMVGRTKMKNWHSACSTWNRNAKKFNQQKEMKNGTGKGTVFGIPQQELEEQGFIF